MKQGKQEHWFGFDRVDGAEKRRRVGKLFSDVAGRYDLMNDLMSLGMHRAWKLFFLELARLRPEHRVLELAAGSGDLASMAFGGGKLPEGYLITDINPEMLARGRERLLDKGCLRPMALMDAERLPLATGVLDRALMSFGLRNVADQAKCLGEIRRVLKPDGMALIMEFSMDLPDTLKPAYDAYTLGWLPLLGKWVAGNEAGYRYLGESIRKQANCEEMLALLCDAGFTKTRANKLAFGAVTIYRAQP